MITTGGLETFFFQAEVGIRGWSVTGVQTCALPIYPALGHAVLHLPFGRAPRRERDRRIRNLAPWKCPIMILNALLPVMYEPIVRTALLEDLGRAEIGRASCRERV